MSVDVRRVVITGADPVSGNVMVRDSSGWQNEILATTRPKATGFPVLGEVWLIRREGSGWLLGEMLGHPSPAIIQGPLVPGSAAHSLVAALVALGLVTDQSTPDASGGTSGLNSAQVQALIDATPISALSAAIADLTMGGNRISGLGTPSSSADATTKAYVDAAVSAAVAGEVDPPTHQTFTQAVSSAVWDITHSLGYVPSVVVTDSARTVIYGDIQVISVSHITITFSAPFAGSAYLS